MSPLASQRLGLAHALYYHHSALVQCHAELPMRWSYSVQTRYSDIFNNDSFEGRQLGSGKDRSVVLQLKNKGADARKPISQYRHVTLKKDLRRNARAISSQLKTYRPDLKAAALARLTQLNNASVKKTQKQRINRRK